MGEKSSYGFYIEPQYVDFTLRARVDALGSQILNTAGTDAQRNGFGVDVLSKNNRSWVLSRMALEIESRPEQYAHTTIKTWINDNGRVLSTRNFEVTDAEGRIFCRAVSQWCLIDFVKRVPVPLSEVMDLCEPYICHDPSPCEAPRKILSVEPTQFVEHKVVYSDIDFNGHVNTMRYIEMMTDMLPMERLKENRPLRRDIHFVHECKWGQVVTIGYEQRDNTALFEIKDDAGIVACRASIEWR